MSFGISEEVQCLNGSDNGSHSPPETKFGVSPPEQSSSPVLDSCPEKSINRKRTNTASSGGGEKRTANKICRVCGDKAFSYNFNVITCESCKAFFRRNANKEREIRCPFNEQCEINIVSRRFCQRCRLAKCFGVGMKKEWIMSDEARLEKKQRVEENRERRIADAISRAEAVEEDDVKNDTPIDVSERVRQRTVLIPVMASHSDQVKTDMRPEEAPSNVKPPDELFSLNVVKEQRTVPIVVPPLLESGSTAVAQSLADVSATTTAAPTMDVDPATTMSSSGFIPPAVESGLLVMPPSNPVDPSFMAQAQLAAAAAAQVQVQAAIKQHQIAAAVAQQVAAHIVNNTPVAAPVAAPIASALNQPTILTPTPASSLLLTPSLNPIPPMTDMVTIPREVLVKLIENNSPRVNCTCQCSCGRYPPGSAIVDEVTKDLLAAGSNTTSAEIKEEVRLDSTEDLHMNGLLPSDESSVHWLNSCAPTVDLSAVKDERSGDRRNSLFTSTGIVDTRIDVVAGSRDLNGLTPSDYVSVNEVLSANLTYSTSDMTDQSRRDGLSLQLMSFTDDNVRCFVRMLKWLPSFNLFNLHDKCILIRRSCVPYTILHSGISYTSNDPRFVEQTSDLQLSDFLNRCLRFYLSFKEELRNSEMLC
ncbi:Zinc finger, C4 type (two domains) [Parelaphostrongylus tenuis]|uniref:Zinc finger, C4 type (Two domains) n=1 Tax=Parelaphostrongylus tenuis TaxID=148309 RepID=A0AAD5M5G6_PARTN|nr:Zinc finger, C4 type (two domains) [Parelaphostrongylus tenuis]